jgi:hypothetical protein
MMMRENIVTQVARKSIIMKKTNISKVKNKDLIKKTS